MPGVSSKCYRVSLYTQTICGTPGKEQKAGLDSGRKLKTSSWGGRARTAHLPHLARLCHLARGSASSGLRTPSMQDHSSEWGSRCRYPGKGQSPGSEGSTSTLSNPGPSTTPAFSATQIQAPGDSGQVEAKESWTGTQVFKWANVHPRQGVNVYLDTPHEVMGTLGRVFRRLCVQAPVSVTM